MRRDLLFLALAPALLTGACARAQKPSPAIQTSSPIIGGSGFVWFEAENPKATNFPARHSFMPASDTEKAILSGGAWIGAEGPRSLPLFLEYDVTVSSTGSYDFYARKFWKHGPFRWRFDQQAWQSVGKDPALLDDSPIRQFVGANWVGAGDVTLTAGTHTLRIELTENNGAAAFDCFVLTRVPFIPRGKSKPGEKLNRTESGWFAFEPDLDTFQSTALDLRGLNEKTAGENGFIVRKGEHFVHSKTGQPERFWAVNAGGELTRMPQTSLNYLARDLAKKGVNLVRIHGALWKDSNFREIDPEKLAGLQRFVAALKKQGIYSCLSIYFPLWLEIPAGDALAGYTTGKKPFALLFFSPEFQQIYRSWWRTILTAPNPIGEPLGKDPAVAMAELCNEDSYLFWTFSYDNIPTPQMALLEKLFGEWLGKKYGSVEAALAAWKQPDAKDKPAESRVAFLPIWDLGNKRGLRSQDTVAFLAQSQRAFFDGTAKFLKADLGFGAVVYGSNWVTGSPQFLGPLDKWSNTGTNLDAMDRHGYFGGKHEGPRASYSLSVGDLYEDKSALKSPEDGLPLFDLKWNGLPSMVSEVNWPMPNRFRADLPLLAAAYGALQGSSAIHFFALSGASWNQQHGKFDLQVPSVLGQSPAAALIFRKGLVKTAPVVVEANLKLTNLLSLQGAPVSAPMNLDALRAADLPSGQTKALDTLPSLDPLAYLVGQVRANISEAGAPSKLGSLAGIDRQRKVVKSATSELIWNWGSGRAVIAAPQVNALTGFLADAGTVTLPGMTVTSQLEYGTITLVSLDGQPLATSKKLLLQVMSEDKNWGWKTAPGEKGLQRIESLGGAPILVKHLNGTIALTRPDAASLNVTALDTNSYPVAKVGNAKIIRLRPDTLYYLIEK